jgi:4-hydroxy-3-polyprenylbenzoate decarboxylase
MAYRANPVLDMQIIDHKNQGHGPRSKRNNGQDSSLLVNAMLKEKFPPISLPKREYMERSLAIWNELGLPPITPEPPWHGYSLGEWWHELDEEAQLAVDGRWAETGAKLAGRRRTIAKADGA